MSWVLDKVVCLHLGALLPKKYICYNFNHIYAIVWDSHIIKFRNWSQRNSKGNTCNPEGYKKNFQGTDSFKEMNAQVLNLQVLNWSLAKAAMSLCPIIISHLPFLNLQKADFSPVINSYYGKNLRVPNNLTISDNGVGETSFTSKYHDRALHFS